MATFETNPSMTQFLAFKLGKFLSQRSEAKAREATHVRAWFITTIRFVFQVGALGCLTWAGFTITMTAGLVVAGLSLFVLSWLTTSQPASPRETPDPLMTRR
jgi:hypothetical protein